jgi:hypothetical protein
MMFVELLAPLVPLTCAAQVRAAHPALFEEPLRWCPVVALRVPHRSAWLLVKRAINIVCESLERGDMPPGTGAHRACQEDAEGGEAEAALAVLGRRAATEDADTTVRVVGEVARCEGTVQE